MGPFPRRARFAPDEDRPGLCVRSSPTSVFTSVACRAVNLLPLSATLMIGVMVPRFHRFYCPSASYGERLASLSEYVSRPWVALDQWLAGDFVLLDVRIKAEDAAGAEGGDG